MRRFLPIALGALSLSCWTAVPAAAQSTTLPEGNLDIRILDIGSRDPETNLSLDFLPINQRECAADIPISLRVRNIPPSASVLDFWRTDTADCSDETLRSDNTRTECTPLEIAADQNTSGNQEKDIVVRASEIVPCEDGRTSSFQIFILAATAENSTGDVGQNFGRFPARVDTAAPAAPTGLAARDGEVRFEASWEPSGETLREYFVYIDDSGCGGTASGDGGATDGGSTDGGPTDGGTAPMDAGALPMDGGTTTGDGSVGGGTTDGEVVIPEIPEFPGFTFVKSINGSADSAGISAEAYPVGSSVTLGIVAVDEAKNISEMATVCVTRIDTTGFCEARGGCPNNCSVSAPGTPESRPATAGLVALVLGALLAVRRRLR